MPYNFSLDDMYSAKSLKIKNEDFCGFSAINRSRINKNT